MKKKFHVSNTERRTAIFSECEKYRYTLEIIWDFMPEPKLMQIIGLNPSTATHESDDPTLRRCKAFAKREGCGGLVMTNIFAYRDTDPYGMLAHCEPIGEPDMNDSWLRHTAERCTIHVAAWGVHGEHLGRGRAVAKLIHTLTCLGKTVCGEPRHPLYLKSTAPLIPFSYDRTA